MKSVSMLRKRHVTSWLVTAAGLFTLFAGPFMIAPATAGALSVVGGNTTTACTPGDIKTVKGEKYVCNRKGKWVHVLNMTAVGVTGATGGSGTGSGQAGGLVATGTGTGGTTILDQGGAGGCGYGSRPGDYMTSVVTISINGKRTSSTVKTSICGKDGQWHALARLGSGGGITGPAGTTGVRAVGS